MLDGIYDSPRGNDLAWEGNLRGLACRPLSRILVKWRHISRTDRPPSDLIVRISKRLTKVVEQLARSPRTILQRRRSMEPINRLREMDVTCAQWLVKQPGRTVVEKAGSKRALMVVQRFETRDTLENRVFMDVLVRARQQCKHYLALYSTSFPSHPSVREVKAFLKLCEHVLRLPEFMDVSSLPAIPQPNYALLSEPRYHLIWWAYQQLIRQHLRRRHLWTYRNNAWNEVLYCAILGSMRKLIRRRSLDALKRASRSDIWVSERTQEGKKIDRGTQSPNWAWRSDQRLIVAPYRELLAGEALHRHAMEISKESVCVLMSNRSSVQMDRLGVFSPEFACDSEKSNLVEDQSELELKFSCYQMHPECTVISQELLRAPVDLTRKPGFLDNFMESLVS
ncbi:MAG: DUF2357 domain-containing protein [bacterium]|nr:DUF2357 domain-containing protein [bacterium]